MILKELTSTCHNPVTIEPYLVETENPNSFELQFNFAEENSEYVLEYINSNV